MMARGSIRDRRPCLDGAMPESGAWCVRLSVKRQHPWGGWKDKLRRNRLMCWRKSCRHRLISSRAHSFRGAPKRTAQARLRVRENGLIARARPALSRCHKDSGEVTCIVLLVPPRFDDNARSISTHIFLSSPLYATGPDSKYPSPVQLRRVSICMNPATKTNIPRRIEDLGSSPPPHQTAKRWIGEDDYNAELETVLDRIWSAVFDPRYVERSSYLIEIVEAKKEFESHSEAQLCVEQERDHDVISTGYFRQLELYASEDGIDCAIIDALSIALNPSPPSLHTTGASPLIQEKKQVSEGFSETTGHLCPWMDDSRIHSDDREGGPEVKFDCLDLESGGICDQVEHIEFADAFCGIEAPELFEDDANCGHADELHVSRVRRHKGSCASFGYESRLETIPEVLDVEESESPSDENAEHSHKGSHTVDGSITKFGPTHSVVSLEATASNLPPRRNTANGAEFPDTPVAVMVLGFPELANTSTRLHKRQNSKITDKLSSFQWGPDGVATQMQQPLSTESRNQQPPGMAYRTVVDVPRRSGARRMPRGRNHRPLPDREQIAQGSRRTRRRGRPGAAGC